MTSAEEVQDAPWLETSGIIEIQERTEFRRISFSDVHWKKVLKQSGRHFCCTVSSAAVGSVLKPGIIQRCHATRHKFNC